MPINSHVYTYQGVVMTNDINKVSNSKLRKLVFNTIDENQSKKIDAEETKMGAIFGLKEGDKKIKRKGFNKALAIDFINNLENNKKIAHKDVIYSDADIDKCYGCQINEKDNSVSIEGSNNNTLLVQHGDGHKVSVDGENIVASKPKDSPNKKEDIGLCVECEVNIVDNSVDIDGYSVGNTVVYQDNRQTVIIQNNQGPEHHENKNEININDCVDCSTVIEDNSTNLQGSNENKIVKQNGNHNDAQLKNK